jgi:hypothetical protein
LPSNDGSVRFDTHVLEPGDVIERAPTFGFGIKPDDFEQISSGAFFRGCAILLGWAIAVGSLVYRIFSGRWGVVGGHT